jgi:hypothetical protein
VTFLKRLFQRRPARSGSGPVAEDGPASTIEGPGSAGPIRRLTPDETREWLASTSELPVTAELSRLTFAVFDETMPAQLDWQWHSNALIELVEMGLVEVLRDGGGKCWYQLTETGRQKSTNWAKPER